MVDNGGRKIYFTLQATESHGFTGVSQKVCEGIRGEKNTIVCVLSSLCYINSFVSCNDYCGIFDSKSLEMP